MTHKQDDTSRMTTGDAYCGLRPSSARLSASTLTCGSPRNPSVRPCTCCATIALTAATLIPRALATRGACQYAPSGEISGSMPLALEVTRSIGGGPEAPGFCFSSAAIVALVESI